MRLRGARWPAVAAATTGSEPNGADEPCVDRVFAAVEGDVPDETDEAFERLAKEHQQEAQVYEALDDENRISYPTAGCITNCDLKGDATGTQERVSAGRKETVAEYVRQELK